MIARLPSVGALCFVLTFQAAVAVADVWDSAYDEARGRRFIPLQLVIGGDWNGERTISYPSGTFHELVEYGSTWTGPRQWTHPKTGEVLAVYDRSRVGRGSRTEQVFAVRRDRTAIGRVEDNRFGITACDQEGKYPLGEWSQGESRQFEYTCWYGNRVEAKVTTITIRDLDFNYGGFRHAIRLEWMLRNKDSGTKIDHAVYVFAPGKGIVNIR